MGNSPEELDAAKTHAAPTTIMLGGTEYKMSRIKSRHIGMAGERLRDKRVGATVRNVVGMSVPIIAQAIAHTTCQDPTDAEIWAYFESAEGVAYMYWLAMQKYTPSLTEKKVAELLDDNPEMRGVLFANSGLYTPPAATDEDDEDKGPDFPVFAPPSPSDGTKEPGT